jgi:hypothetical protein
MAVGFGPGRIVKFESPLYGSFIPERTTVDMCVCVCFQR